MTRERPNTAATQVSEAAAKEYNIEVTLDNMLGDWTGLELQIFPYRDTGTGVLKGVDEVQAILDEHVTMTQARSRRPFTPSTRVVSRRGGRGWSFFRC